MRATAAGRQQCKRDSDRDNGRDGDEKPSSAARNDPLDIDHGTADATSSARDSSFSLSMRPLFSSASGQAQFSFGPALKVLEQYANPGSRR
jgi:hypothetical protein